MKPKVTVVLPTLYEESIFEVIHDIYRLLGRDTEIIAIARGGDEYFRKLRKLGVKVVYQKVKSVEGSIRIGFNMAKGELLASTDSDATHDSSGLLKAVKMIEAGEADMVMGNRMNKLQPGSMGTYVAFGNRALSLIFSILYRMRLHDILTGLFVMDRKSFELMKNIKPYRAGTAFFVMEAAKRGARIKEVDIKYYPRKYGNTKLSRFKLAYGLALGVRLIAHII